MKRHDHTPNQDKNIQGFNQQINIHIQEKRLRSGDVNLEQLLSIFATNEKVDLPFKNLDILNIEDKITELLLVLIKGKYSKEIFRKLPNKINLKALPLGSSYLLSEFCRQGFTNDLVKKIEFNKIGPEDLSEGASYLLYIIATNGHEHKVINKLLNIPIDINNLSNEYSSLLFDLKDFINFEEIFKLVSNQRIDFNKISVGGGHLISLLIFHYNHQLVFEKIKDQKIELSKITIGAAYLLSDLLYKGYSDHIFKMIMFKKSKKLSDAASILLYRFKRPEQKDQIRKKISPKKINLYTMSYDEINFILNLNNKKRSDIVLEIINKKGIDFSKLSNGGAILLSIYLNNKIEASITNKIRNIDTKNLTHSKVTLVKIMYENNHISPELYRKFSAFTAKPTEFKKNDIQEIKRKRKFSWPKLEEQLLEFPIILDSARRRDKNWTTILMEKLHSNTKIYLKFKNGKLINAVFRNHRMSNSLMTQYRRALEVIPNSIPRSIYPELAHSKTKERKLSKNSKSFREVYVGPSIKSLDMDSIPQKIAEEIRRQQIRIFLKLGLKGISHKDAHNGNFNVRFLLKNPQNNKKEVFFDLNQAAKKMQKNSDLILTPIVTLRDWDSIH